MCKPVDGVGGVMEKNGELNVTFRLGRPYTDRLQLAADESGLSPGQYARLCVLMHFEETALHRIVDELHAIRAELRQLKCDRDT